MRLFILTILFFQLFTSQNCTSKESESTAQSWLNIKYIECLRNNLPCHCEKITETYFSLSVETNPDSKNYGIALSKFDWMEPYLYPIKKLTNTEYAVLKSGEDATSWAKLVLKGKELEFIENDIVSKFSKSKYNEYNAQHYLNDNVNLVNQSFVARGYPTLENILKENSLNCDCNKSMGNVNIVYVQGAAKSWIMTIKNDSLEINKITNTDKDPDDPVQTEKVSGYKW
jgi:hypothetical protein